jgi:hypothetical protein
LKQFCEQDSHRSKAPHSGAAQSIDYVIILQTMVSAAASHVDNHNIGKKSLLQEKQYTAVEDCVQFI